VIALVLMPVRNQRHGGNGGPGYIARASMAARNKARHFLEEHFTIVNKPLPEVGWQLGANNILKV
jgi:hypothetical protein